jgi:hypothetical protein
MKITNVNVDLTTATATVVFEDGSSQVIVAPLAPEVQGVGLAELQKTEADAVVAETAEQAVVADATADVAVETPTVTEAPVEAPAVTSTTA